MSYLRGKAEALLHGPFSALPADPSVLMFSLGSSHPVLPLLKSGGYEKGLRRAVGAGQEFHGQGSASVEVYVILNRNRNRFKPRHWEDGGFVVYYKRLEKGTFIPPKSGAGRPSIRWPGLVLMVKGIQVEKFSQKPRYVMPEK